MRYVCRFYGFDSKIRDLIWSNHFIFELQIAGDLSSVLRKGRVLKEQACYLPCSNDGLPFIGKIGTEYDGAYIASGHGCWGILNGPGMYTVQKYMS